MTLTSKCCRSFRNNISHPILSSEFQTPSAYPIPLLGYPTGICNLALSRQASLTSSFNITAPVVFSVPVSCLLFSVPLTPYGGLVYLFVCLFIFRLPSVECKLPLFHCPRWGWFSPHSSRSLYKWHHPCNFSNTSGPLLTPLSLKKTHTPSANPEVSLLKTYAESSYFSQLSPPSANPSQHRLSLHCHHHF